MTLQEVGINRQNKRLWLTSTPGEAVRQDMESDNWGQVVKSVPTSGSHLGQVIPYCVDQERENRRKGLFSFAGLETKMVPQSEK